MRVMPGASGDVHGRACSDYYSQRLQHPRSGVQGSSRGRLSRHRDSVRRPTTSGALTALPISQRGSRLKLRRGADITHNNCCPMYRGARPVVGKAVTVRQFAKRLGGLAVRRGTSWLDR